MMETSSTGRQKKPPNPQFLSLARPESYSITGRAADAKLHALCRAPDAMLFGPRSGLLVHHRRNMSGATPLSLLSAPKHPLPAPAAALAKASYHHPTKSRKHRLAAPGTRTTANSNSTCTCKAAAARTAMVHHHSPEFEQLDTDRRHIRQQVRQVKAARDAEAEAAEYGSGCSAVWARERPVLSRGFVTASRSRQRVRRRNKHLIGEELIRGTTCSSDGKTLHSHYSRQPPVDCGEEDGKAERRGGQTAAGGGGGSSLGGAAAAAAAPAGRLKFTRAFLRSWELKQSERRAQAAVQARAAIQAVLAAAGVAEEGADGGEVAVGTTAKTIDSSRSSRSSSSRSSSSSSDCGGAGGGGEG